MDSFVFAAVLAAAAAHAGWNAVIKGGLEPFAMMVLITLGAGIASLALMPVVGLPAAASWPWVAASVVVHFFYSIGLIGAYRAGDMGQVYPLARGAAPVMTAMISTTWLAEPLGPVGWCGLLLLVAGVVILSLRGGGDLVRLDRRAIGYALFTAVTICAYSIVDGVGARTAGNASAYAVTLFAGIGIVMAAYAMVLRGPQVFVAMAPFWRRGVGGGAMQMVSYWIAIWAMTVAPIALVAALRETSVLFGALIAVVILKEPLRAARVVAALMIVAGLAAMRLA
ncbi:EamA family transporter [Xanthobacteraceae bacterium Astr-EGSB]|uniref:EamA family transporter n=1 Tax=Astrobacterium formosum TaxID=3069710 RepID=UPI0027B26BC6|nr:EamA family transporter [Xanthobacteraceae bacterium Astr-EGSB]